MTSELAYRPEIDGLRALAVLLVICYHMGQSSSALDWLPGGLVGVDVFFVISGYLITGIILRRLKAGNFSIVEFYERRMRRIIPSLLLVMLVSLPFGYVYLFPRPFYEYAQSIQAAIFFVSNVFFWRLDAYTAEASQFQPFLHTWSLSVEEQYYLIFPVSILLTLRLFPRHLLTVLLAAFFLSLTVSIWGGDLHPQATFYLLPTRGWELLAGAILAKLELDNGRSNFDQGVGLLSGIAVLLIVVPAAIFGDQLETPGVYSLLPVTGASIIIWFAQPQSLVTRAMSSPVPVGIGLISYSAYLWHQPVLVFSRIVATDVIRPGDVLMQVALAFVLAYVSWLFIERPFRNQSLITVRQAGTILLTAAAVVIAATFIMTDVKKRQEAQPIENMLLGGYQEIALEQDGKPCHSRSVAEACRFGSQDATERWYVVGDSHASVLAASLQPLLNGKPKVLFTSLTTAGCHYAPGLYRENGDVDQCNDFNVQWKAELLSAELSTVVITGRLPLYLSGVGNDNGEGGVEPRKGLFLTNDPHGERPMDLPVLQHSIANSLQELSDYGHRLVLVYPQPEPGWNVPQQYAKLVNQRRAVDYLGWREGGLTTSYDRFRKRTAEAYAVYDAVTGGGDKVVRIYSEELFCNTTVVGRCLTHSRSEIYYRDDNHLSLYGARIVARDLLAVVNEGKNIHPME